MAVVACYTSVANFYYSRVYSILVSDETVDVKWAKWERVCPSASSPLNLATSLLKYVDSQLDSGSVYQHHIYNVYPKVIIRLVSPVMCAELLSHGGQKLVYAKVRVCSHNLLLVSSLTSCTIAIQRSWQWQSNPIAKLSPASKIHIYWKETGKLISTSFIEGDLTLIRHNIHLQISIWHNLLSLAVQWV